MIEKAREFQKNTYFCFTDYVEPLCGSQLRKILKEMGISDTLPASWETCIWVKKQQLEPDMEWVVQNWERNMTRLCIVILFI